MGNRPPRLPNFDYIGFYRYHVRISTWEGAPHFTQAAIVCVLRSQMLHTAVGSGMAVKAYCFMPDHAHVLAQGMSPTANLRAFVGRWKQRGAHDVEPRHRIRLWRTGFFDRVLRENEDDAAVARYILENPVRAGLAKRVGEYPFAWSVWGLDTLYR